MTSSITKTTAAIFYQKSEVVQEEYRLIELVTLRETEINYLQKTLIGEVNEGRCKLDDNITLKTFESFNKVRRYTIDLLKGISKWQESFVRPIRPKLLDCDYIIDRLCHHINFINTSSIRKIFNFRFMKGNVLLLPYPSSSKIEPIYVNNELLLQIKEFIQPNEEDIIICYQILINCLPDDIYKNDVASLKDWLINCWIPRIWTIEDSELFQKKKTKLTGKNKTNKKKNSGKMTKLISYNNYDETLVNIESPDNNKFQKRVSIIDNYENSNNHHLIAPPINNKANKIVSNNIISNTSSSSNIPNNDNNDDDNSMNSNTSLHSTNSNNMGKLSRRLSMKKITHNDSSSTMNNMIHPSTTNNIDTATTTATTTNITKKKKEYEKQLIEIGEFYQNLILSIQPPSHDLNFKQEKITFQLLVSSNNDEPLESAIGVSSMIEKEKSDDDHEKNDDDDDDEKDDDDDDDDDIEVDPVIDVDMVDVDTTTNSNDKNVEVKKIKSSSAYKKNLLSITTPTTPTTNENSTFITTNKNKTTKSILRDVKTPPKLTTTTTTTSPSPSLPSQKHSRRMSDITMNTTTIQQQQQQPPTRSMKSKFNTMAAAAAAAAAAITTTSPLPKISFPNIKLTKSSIHTIKGKPSTPIKSRRMSELTVTFSNIDGDHGSVYSNSTTTSTIINTNENKNFNNNKNKNNDNIMSSIKNDHKIKLKRIAKKKIISLPSTDLHLSTAMMRVWYANNKTADDINNNITKSINTNSSRGSSRSSSN